MAIFHAHPRDRLQVFIDGQNLFSTLKGLEQKIDFKVLAETLRDETRLVRSQYFTTVRPQQDTEQFRKVLDFLHFNGYSVEKKEVRDAIDAQGHTRQKGTIVPEIAQAMIDAADNGTDHIVLFSGDDALTAAVMGCKRRDARVTVVSSERLRVISEDLRRACDQYVDLEDLPPTILLPLNSQWGR